MAKGRRRRRAPARKRARRGVNGFRGGVIRGRSRPTLSSASPWNNYTVTTVWTPPSGQAGIQCYGATSLRAVVRKELGLASDFDMDVRVMRIDVWVPPANTNSDRNCIVFSPCDWTSFEACDKVRQLAWYEEWGTAVLPAHLHYVWPKTLSVHVIPGNKDFPLCKFDVKNDKMSYIVKFHVQWRPPTPDAYTATYGRVDAMRDTWYGPSPPDDFEELCALDSSP